MIRCREKGAPIGQASGPDGRHNRSERPIVDLIEPRILHPKLESMHFVLCSIHMSPEAESSLHKPQLSLILLLSVDQIFPNFRCLNEVKEFKLPHSFIKFEKLIEFAM